jgi:hypothetical protein
MIALVSSEIERENTGKEEQKVRAMVVFRRVSSCDFEIEGGFPSNSRGTTSRHKEGLEQTKHSLHRH